MTKKDSLDAFLIIRITKDEKNYLLEAAKKRKIGLSKLVRQIISDYIGAEKSKDGKED